MLIPNSNIESSIFELNNYFVAQIPTDSRRSLYENYLSYSNEMKFILGVNKLKQWINGSFVTKVKNPKDIDLVTFLDFESRLKFEFELRELHERIYNLKIGVDAYLVTVFPEEHSKSFLYKSDYAYWLDRFTKTRGNHSGRKLSKGFLEIIH